MMESYYDPAYPFGYSGARNYNAKDKKWLSSQGAYTLHKPGRRKYQRNQFFSKGIAEFWQADLADMSKLSRWNSGYRYLLFVIDVFSKYLWVKPLKNKKPESIVKAFDSIGQQPKLLMTDKGGEFQNKKVKNHFKNTNVYSSENPDTKASIAERVIRTIKTKLYRYMTHNRSNHYINVIEKFVSAYNSTAHSSIGMAPTEVNSSNENTVRNRLYKKPKKIIKTKYQPGNKVKIWLDKGPFRKGYTKNWSDETFEIIKILPRYPPVYKLIDMNGEIISSVFYEAELQRISGVH